MGRSKKESPPIKSSTLKPLEQAEAGKGPQIDTNLGSDEEGELGRIGSDPEPTPDMGAGPGDDVGDGDDETKGRRA